VIYHEGHEAHEGKPLMIRSL